MRLFRKPIQELAGFNDLWLRLIGIPAVAFLSPAAFFNTSLLAQPEKYMAQFMVSLVFTTIYWHVDWLICAYFRSRYPRVEQIKQRLVRQMAWILAFTLIICNLGEICVVGLRGGVPPDFAPSRFQINFGSMVVTVAIVAVYEAIYAIYMWRKSLIESERLKKENMQSQLETLKNQVNPHFLFNSLNTLTALIPDQPEKAVEFTQHLSKVYRCILEIKNRELITLREEMECIASYRFLLEMRFGNNVQFEVDIPEEKMDNYVVPLCVQMLLENAVKHNVISTARPLKITITLGKNGQLLVTNNLQKKESVNGSTRTGLSNIRNRYHLVSDKEVDVIITRDHFSVVLPLLQIEDHETAHHRG